MRLYLEGRRVGTLGVEFECVKAEAAAPHSITRPPEGGRYAGLSEVGFAHFGYAAFVDHFAGALVVGEPENDFVAGFPFCARLQDRPVQFDPVAAHQVIPFAPLKFELAIGLERERGCGAGDGFPGDPGFGADILASDIVALRAAFGRASQGQQTSAGDHQELSWKPI